MKKILIVLAACFTFVGCQPSTSSPAPVSESRSDDLLVMRVVWEDVPASDKADICWFFDLSPREAFEAFNNSSPDGEIVPFTTFTTFFDSVC